MSVLKTKKCRNKNKKKKKKTPCAVLFCREKKKIERGKEQKTMEISVRTNSTVFRGVPCPPKGIVRISAETNKTY